MIPSVASTNFSSKRPGRPRADASGSSSVQIVNRRVSVAEFIADYSPLENVSAFRRFQEALAERYPYKSLIT